MSISGAVLAALQAVPNGARAIIGWDGTDIQMVKTDSSGRLLTSGDAASPGSVQGNVASGAADSGNPVKVGGVHQTVSPTLTAGQRGDVQLGSVSQMLVGIRDDPNISNLARVSTPQDAYAASNAGLNVVGHTLGYNGATWDRLRTPNIFKPFASTAITAGTGATIWTPAAGKKFRVMGILISSSAAGQLILGDNLAATVFMRSDTLAAAGTWKLGAADLGNGFLSAAANNVLKIDGPTGNVAGMVWGTEE